MEGVALVVGLEHLAARGLDLTLRFAPLEELIAATREAPPEVEGHVGAVGVDHHHLLIHVNVVAVEGVFADERRPVPYIGATTLPQLSLQV